VALLGSNGREVDGGARRTGRVPTSGSLFIGGPRYGLPTWDRPGRCRHVPRAGCSPRQYEENLELASAGVPARAGAALRAPMTSSAFLRAPPPARRHLSGASSGCCRWPRPGPASHCSCRRAVPCASRPRWSTTYTASVQYRRAVSVHISTGCWSWLCALVILEHGRSHSPVRRTDAPPPCKHPRARGERRWRCREGTHGRMSRRPRPGAAADGSP